MISEDDRLRAVADTLVDRVRELRRERGAAAALETHADHQSPTAATDFHCSFCGRSRQEVQKLISGPRVFICNYCVATCIQNSASLSEPSRPEIVPIRSLVTASAADHGARSCSFCNQPHHTMRLLFRSAPIETTATIPLCAICSTCLGLCVDILAHDLRGEWVDHQRLWPEASKE
jgi:hypothetical protein